jgi:glyoxylase-like metal-dependent hydrolase (beta-lactamase superfamily II)
MKRGIVLGMLVATGALSIGISAYQQPAAGRGPQGPPSVDVEKVKDNLFVFRGGGGNSAVFVQANGITVVDTKNPGWGQPILDRIRELTNKPVTTIINTHTHGDHVSGNVEFPATVDVVVQENTAANMKKMVPAMGGSVPPGTPSIFDQNKGRGLPKRTFTDRMTLGTGADQIDLYYFGRGHTNGDAWVLFPALRVLHSGDMFANKGIPLVDGSNGGSAVEYPETLSKASATFTNVDTIITGHSTLMTPKDLQEFASFMREFVEAIRAGKKAGQSVDQIAKGWTIPAKFTGYATPQAERLRQAIQIGYDEIR